MKLPVLTKEQINLLYQTLQALGAAPTEAPVKRKPKKRKAKKDLKIRPTKNGENVAYILQNKTTKETWPMWIGDTRKRLKEELKAQSSLDLLETHRILKIKFEAYGRKPRTLKRKTARG